MKINLAKSAGFCFGVKRALNIALTTASCAAKVYMLGDIVHNEEVVRQVKKNGIKKIKTLKPLGRNKILLIPAHGVSLKILRQAQRLRYRIIDATCPMVKEIHKIAKTMEQKGYRIIVIGDMRHDEVEGIVGQLKNKAIVIDPATIHSYAAGSIKSIKKASVVVQSTQDLKKVLEIVRVLKTYIQELKFFNTICEPTRIKQQEIKTLPLENDVMIIIGSKNSANTKRLYEISKALNKQTYWINSKREIKLRWFKDAEKVGVSAGASTPESTIQDVVKYISLLNH